MQYDFQNEGAFVPALTIRLRFHLLINAYET